MEQEVGFFEVKPKNKSFTRLSIAWYFWMICFPGSMWVLYVLGTAVLKQVLTISDGGTLFMFFVVLQMGWIAPKQLSKIMEAKDYLKK